jgi:excisionase family DNA binding protein
LATRGKKEKEYPPMPANWMYKRGDVYMMDLNPYSGSEQGGIRPAIVVQNDDGNFYSNVLLVVPLTTQIKKRNMPTHFIVISSFEKWYANQVKYHKVNGPPPGEELCKRSYSVPDAAEILKVKPETIYTLIRQGKLKTETADFCMRIPKEEFERWYRSQSRYRTAADRERDREIEAQTISIPEMAKLLGIPRKNVYGILDCKKYRDCFVIERVADRPRITKKSFKAWLKSQSTYQLQKPKKETHEEPPLKLQCPKNGKYYSFQEIQAFYGISRPTLDSWVLKEGIPTMKLGRVKRIQKDAFDEVLKSKRKVEEDV